MASLPSAMRPRTGWQPLSGQAGMGLSCTASSMMLEKGGKETFSDFIWSPALAATMARRRDATRDSQ